MINKETYSYEIVEKMSFNRVAGTEDEKRVAELIAGEIEQAGGKAEIFTFPIPGFKINKVTAKITAPFEKELEVMAYGNSGSFEKGGRDLKLLFLEGHTPGNLRGITDLSDTCVFINQLGFDMYKVLLEKKAAAFMVPSGKWYDTPENSDLVVAPIYDEFLTMGKIPGFKIRAYDAIDIIRREATSIHLELEQDEFEATCHDVIANIEGTEIPEESITLTAHMDSVSVGTGSWDNATGSATLLYIYHHFLQHPAKHTLRFIWCGGEEEGLYGSVNYIKYHEDLMKEIKFEFNFDMCGTVLGSNHIGVTGPDELKTFAEQLISESGVPCDPVKVSVHSSDSAPFNDRGVPSMSIGRGHRGSAEIHTRYDQIYPISAKKLKENGDFAIFCVDRVANSVFMPVGLGMPEKVKKEVDDYFWKEKLAPYRKKAEEKKEETK